MGLHVNDLTYQEEAAGRCVESRIAGKWRYGLWWLALYQGEIRAVCWCSVTNEVICTRNRRGFLGMVFRLPSPKCGIRGIKVGGSSRKTTLACAIIEGGRREGRSKR